MLQESEDLSYMMGILQEEYAKTGLKINLTKTEYLATIKEEIGHLQIDNNIKIKGKGKYKYLGFIITKTATEEEIRD